MQSRIGTQTSTRPENIRFSLISAEGICFRRILAINLIPGMHQLLMSTYYAEVDHRNGSVLGEAVL